MSVHPRRRSCLTVPAGSEKMLRKAIGLPADEIVLDLEDSVAPAGKEAARRLLVETVGSGAFGSRSVAVRVNAVGTPWCHLDIAALSTLDHPGLTIVLPKTASAGDLAFVDRLLDGLEQAAPRAQPIGLQLLIETAAGLANCMASAGASSRLQSLIIGYGDLASALGRDETASWAFVHESILLAARANGLQAIDGPNFRLQSGNERLDADCATTASLGFDGKWAIHPSQLEPINAAFTPRQEAVTRARQILACLDAARRAGEGIATFDGAMIDEAMRAGALRVIAMAEGAASP